MASPAADIGHSHQQHHPVTESAAEPAFQEAQKWIEAVTGRCFGDRDFRGGLENGILLCELLSSIRPGLVKKINRLPTPIAGLDNLSVFLRGCEELGLKGSQLFDPGDLQDTSTRPTAKGSDCSRRLKNVLITIYWLGRSANGCISYSGPTLDLKEFEGLLSQMRKDAEVADSPTRSIRDSGYVDCWESERSDSLSPPRHGREDSFDSLDSFGSRSQQTPSPDILVARGSSDGRGSDSESDGPFYRRMPDLHKDDMLARRTSVTELRTAMPFNQYLPNKSNQTGYVPTPLRKKRNDKEEGGRKSWSTATSPVGGDRPCRSLSMIDMRDEEEVILHPHSQVRHELMHNHYNKLKEEENHWQDDLARWKSRRRSISQDLIKKEEERKTMERLLSGDSCISQRRRSIKTYREIVEEKERREEELRQAYKRARNPEEASAILQRYAQRFSISESILERLQLPKLLDRSISADPFFPISLTPSPTTPDPFDMDFDGSLKYLRQQSAPTPKFTSLLEAQIEEFPKDSSSQQRPQIRSRSSDPPSTRALSPTPVALLTPKPYFQPRPSPADSRNNKPESHEEESPPRFQASPSRSRNRPEGTLSSEDSPVQHPHTGQKKTDGTQISVKAASQDVQEEKVTEHLTPPSRPTSLTTELQKHKESFRKTESQDSLEEVKSNTAVEEAPPADAKQEDEAKRSSEKLIPPGINTQNTFTTQVPLSQEPSQRMETAPRSAAPAPFGHHSPKETSDSEKDCRTVVSVPVLPQARQGNRWSWDPDEERKRQERWQQEQERVLQEKYQREQEKLKEEWEKAQREVVEEGRKYHEEERRILEETVMPLTPRSSALPSPSRGELSSSSELQDTIVRSLADWERKQELLERQSRGNTESSEWRQREKDRTSDTSTADDSMDTGRSLVSQNSSQAERLGHGVHNGQKFPPPPAKPSTPVRKPQEPPAESDGPSRPAGERRSGSINNNIRSSSSKPAAACPSAPDMLPPPPNRSVSGKKLCSSCGQPLGKGAAMIIETLSLYFHIHCFKCGVCKGQLGDTTTGTDVRIRNGLLNCNQCYIRSRSAGQPTML
ncbi:LIM and calponin homology domains-containing protein 1 isoform X4 [Nothobranchius furzeri]|uniref:LIM and calponin homology domains-containing protein 1 isoform X4 n=1 Tax=Nothobranchius furzeri TaxID=105023 RepID=UPI003904D351